MGNFIVEKIGFELAEIDILEAFVGLEFDRRVESELGRMRAELKVELATALEGQPWKEWREYRTGEKNAASRKRGLIPWYACQELVNQGWKVRCNAALVNSSGNQRVWVLGKHDSSGLAAVLKMDGRLELVDSGALIPLEDCLRIEAFTPCDSWFQCDSGVYKVLGYKVADSKVGQVTTVQLDVCCKQAVIFKEKVHASWGWSDPSIFKTLKGK